MRLAWVPGLSCVDASVAGGSSGAGYESSYGLAKVSFPGPGLSVWIPAAGNAGQSVSQ